MSVPKVDESRQRNLYEAGRLVSFSDGVAAIAMTLLILPLSDVTLPPESQWPHRNVFAALWNGYHDLILSFLLSFFVIAIFWLFHHQLFDKIEYVDGTLIKINFLWLFAVVVLPFPTNLLSDNRNNTTVAFYIGTMCFIAASATAMSFWLAKHPDLAKSEERASITSPPSAAWTSTVYLALVFIVAFFAGGLATWLLFGLFFVARFSDRFDDMRATEQKSGEPPTSDPPSETPTSS